MNRDVILATLIGLGLGLLITGVVIVSPQLVKSLPKLQWPALSFLTTPPKPTPVLPTPTPEVFALKITSPLPESIETSKNLLVSGSTMPGSVVVVAGSLDEDVVPAPTDGQYAAKVTLSEGRNDIVVTSYNNNQQKSQTVSVYYTQEEL